MPATSRRAPYRATSTEARSSPKKKLVTSPARLAVRYANCRLKDNLVSSQKRRTQVSVGLDASVTLSGSHHRLDGSARNRRRAALTHSVRRRRAEEIISDPRYDELRSLV